MNHLKKSQLLSVIFFVLLLTVFLWDRSYADTVIRPQDKLNIQVMGEADLSGVYTVNESGEITYPILGPVYVDGLSLQDVKAFLTDSLAKDYLVNPQVNVIFFETPSRAAPVPAIPAEPVLENVPAPLLTPAPLVFAPPAEIDIIDALDKLNIQVYKEPDLSGIFSVSASGKINYPLLGEIYAQGSSLEQFKDFLYQKLNESYVSNPQIEITFEESPNKSVAVLGQVVKPGNYILDHNMTLLKLMSKIGGFTPYASTGSLRIVRSHEGGKKETIEVNVDKITRGTEKDIALKAGDIVFVDTRSKEEEQKKEVDTKNFITILGQVSKPGNYFYSPNLTLIRLVGQAGGFSPIAATGRVKIVRNSKTGGQESFMVDAGRIMGGGAKDLELKEGDLIVVPESYF